MFSKLATTAAMMGIGSGKTKFRYFEEDAWSHPELEFDGVRAKDIVEPVWFSDSFAAELPGVEAADPDGPEIASTNHEDIS
jgi:hypothetical protein